MTRRDDEVPSLRLAVCGAAVLMATAWLLGLL